MMFKLWNTGILGSPKFVIGCIRINFEIEFPRTRNEHVEQELPTFPEHLILKIILM
jgi:hypothetical protein